nr:hypothetical protein [Pseudoalteromonas sp. WY3]
MDEDEVYEIMDLILPAEQLSNESYEKLISNFPLQTTVFPAHLSDSKIKLLVDYKVVAFNIDTYEEILNFSFITTFVINNIDSFMELEEEIDVSEDLIASLLKSKVGSNYKIDLLYDLTLFNEDDKNLAQEIANLIFSVNSDIDKINSKVLMWVTYGARNIETSLNLICMLFDRWDEDEIFDILNNLDEPYRNISIYGKKPRIGNTALDKGLAQLLNDANYISSFRVEDKGVRIYTKQHK